MSLVLRRSASSPCVRVAPYTYPPSPTSSSSPRRRRRGASDAADPTRPRRATSEMVSSRRVLAEIEWWRVMQGQREEVEENEMEDNDESSVLVYEDSSEDASESISSPPVLYPIHETSDDSQSHTYIPDDISPLSSPWSRPVHSRTSSASSDTSSDDFPILTTPPPRLAIFPRPASPSILFPPNTSTTLSSREGASQDVGIYSPAMPRTVRCRANSLSQLASVGAPLSFGEESMSGGPYDTLGS